MTPQQIRALAPRISEYLDEFSDCFVSFETRYHLKQYVQGQFSDLQRKSVEPIAHLMDVPPRTLQEFLSWSEWDHDRLRDTLQRIVARDHAEPQAIGIIDETGHPKKGSKTACVQRQYCGASGKIDNCVMSVHLCHASFDGKFRAMLDSDLYLPEKGWDAERRKEAGIPEPVVYRAKHEMALEQLRRAGQWPAFWMDRGRRVVRGKAFFHRGSGRAGAAFHAGNPKESDGLALLSR